MKPKTFNLVKTAGVLFVSAVILSNTQALGQTINRLPGDAVHYINVVQYQVSPQRVVIDITYNYNFQHGNEVFICAMPLLNGQYIPNAGCRPIKVPRPYSGIGRQVIEKPMNFGGNWYFDGIEINIYKRNYTFIKEKYQLQVRSRGFASGKGDAPSAPSTSPSPEIIFVPILR